MSNARKMRSKVLGIKNTQKITQAMEIVAASKMRVAISKIYKVRPYIECINTVIKNVVTASINYPNPYLYKRDEKKRVGYIVISTDRGLCGGLNINLFKYVLQDIEKHLKHRLEIDICVIGFKAETFFKKLRDVNIVATAQYNEKNQESSMKMIYTSIEVMLNKFVEQNIDDLYLYSNQFISTIKQKPKKKILLPIQNSILEKDEHKKKKFPQAHWDYIYEKDTQEVLDALYKRYIEAQIRGAVLENYACEQASRMITMKNSTDNANDIINQLKLDYNKVRQYTITQELAEICSGAAAV